MTEPTGLGTSELMEIALRMADMTEIPGDSAIYVPGENIRRVMMGIDISTGELLLGKQLGVDAVIAHHPAGGDAQLYFPRVLRKQIEFLRLAGVAEEAARAAVQPRIAAATLRAQMQNHDHAPSVARLLGMPFLNVHLPLDEVGRRMMVDAIEWHFRQLGPDRAPTVRDLVDALKTIPEIRDAKTNVMVPVGKLDNPVGKYVVFHGAGTNGGYPAAKALFEAGVSTVIYIHLTGEDAERLRQLQLPHANVVVSGHISSDMIGINRYVAELEQRGIEVVRMSGL